MGIAWLEKKEAQPEEMEMVERIRPDRKVTPVGNGLVREERSCVILVGTTGAGKTTLLNIYTGAQEMTGSGARSVTSDTVVVEDTIHTHSPVWFDNPGWSDTDGKSDALVFKDLLRKMQDEKIYNLKAVIWAVMPQPRMDAILQAQAKFIDNFTVEHDVGRIWSNVVIIAKGKIAATADEDCQGAKTAAVKLRVHADPVCRGWGLAQPEIVSGAEETLRQKTLRLLTESEIRTELERVFAALPPNVQVVFANQKCKACGQKGDPRLMEDKCHRNKKLGHTGKLVQRYTKTEMAVAAVGGGVGVVGLGVVAGVTGTAEALGALPLFFAPGGFMATHRFMNRPSDAPSACGPVRINDMRWDCCGNLEIGGEGCTEICDLCEVTWGSGPPCVLIRNPDAGMQSAISKYEVFVKDHELVENKE